MKKVVNKMTMHAYDEKAVDLAYWQSRPASERLSAVTFISMGENGWKKKIVRIVHIKNTKDD